MSVSVSSLCLVLVVLLQTLHPGCRGELVCGEVECPASASTCSIKYSVAQMPRRNVTTVNCFNDNKSIVLTKTYEKMLKEVALELPLLVCGGQTCKAGAFSCSTVTTPSLNSSPPKETIHLTCKDRTGGVVEERDVIRSLSRLEATGETPPSCEGHECPAGSRSCSYDTTISLEPYNKTTHIACYDIKNTITLETSFSKLNP